MPASSATSSTSARPGWVAPHLEDHAALMRRAGERAAQDFNFADILPSAQRMSAYGGKQIGIPYRC